MGGLDCPATQPQVSTGWIILSVPGNWETRHQATTIKAKYMMQQFVYENTEEQIHIGFLCRHKDINTTLKKHSMGFPGGAVVESPPASAGDAGSSPGLGGSHMPRSDWACGPQLLNLRVWSLCSATKEAMMVRGPRTAMKSGPHLPQLEKALTEARTQHSQK